MQAVRRILIFIGLRKALTEEVKIVEKLWRGPAINLRSSGKYLLILHFFFSDSNSSLVLNLKRKFLSPAIAKLYFDETSVRRCTTAKASLARL
jgi:hypothetical protein